jgi:hypothetical protein
MAQSSCRLTHKPPVTQHFLPTTSLFLLCHTGEIFNATAIRGQQWWNMTSADRATALTDAAMLSWRESPPESRGHAAAAAAISRLWQYYNHPQQLNQNCQEMEGTAMAALIGLGLLCRLVVWGLVKLKVNRKAQQ